MALKTQVRVICISLLGAIAALACGGRSMSEDSRDIGGASSSASSGSASGGIGSSGIGSSGAASSSGFAGSSSSGAADGGGPLQNLIYVSEKGSDLNNGRTPATPVRTIGAAVRIAATGPLEIHVCAGTYGEPTVIIRNDVALRGAYDCQSWQRAPAWESALDVNKTSIIHTDPNIRVMTPAVWFEGRGVRNAVLEGFHVGTAAQNEATNLTVRVADGANAMIQSNIIKLSRAGGAMTGAAESTSGIQVTFATATIMNNRITAPDVTSLVKDVVLIDLQTARGSKIDGNVLLAGNSSPTRTLAFIRSNGMPSGEMSVPTVIRGNTITDGDRSAQTGLVGVGILLQNDKAVIEGNKLNLTASVRCQGENVTCFREGVVIRGGSASVLRNYVDVKAPSLVTDVLSSEVAEGLRFLNGAEVTAENNMVHVADEGIGSAFLLPVDASAECDPVDPVLCGFPPTLATIRYNTLGIDNRRASFRVLQARGNVTFNHNLIGVSRLDDSPQQFIFFDSCAPRWGLEASRNAVAIPMLATRPLISEGRRIGSTGECQRFGGDSLNFYAGTSDNFYASRDQTFATAVSAWSGNIERNVAQLQPGVSCSIAKARVTTSSFRPAPTTDILGNLRNQMESAIGAYDVALNVFCSP
jgi:hypothetical protein